MQPDTTAPSEAPDNGDVVKKGANEASSEGRFSESAMDELFQMPLFMTKLDDSAGADGENAGLEAIQALQYEGTRSEVARNFKEQGNEMVQSKRWSDAKEFYTKAIAVLTDTSDTGWEEGDDPGSEKQEKEGLAEQCYSNRALCHLELKNYRSTTLDCASALRLNQANLKAHYRSASALLALNKIAEAQDVCRRGLNLDSNNNALRQLSEIIQSRHESEKVKADNRAAEGNRKQVKQTILAAALKARNIALQGSSKSPDLEDAEIQLSPDPFSPQSMLVFPVVVLYPMHAQSDFIKQFAEKDCMIDHLKYIFPLPWDTRQEYQVDSVECYMDTVSGGMVKLGKQVSLLQALSTGQTPIVDGLVRFHVVPVAISGKWIEEVKKRKKAGGKG